MTQKKKFNEEMVVVYEKAKLFYREKVLSAREKC